MITLCVSTFNRADLLDQMLASFEKEIRKTRNVLTEFVILLNGCTDNSKAVVARWQACFEGLGVKTIIRENLPPLYVLDSYALGTSLASNKYVWFFGDDDVVYNDVLARLSDALLANPDIGVLALNWQSVEFDLTTRVASPRLTPGSGGRYDSWFDFAQVAGIMPLSFLSAIIVRAEGYLQSPTIREHKFVSTQYLHLCAIIEGLGSEPLFALEPVCILARLNYRLDQNDRSSKPLAVQVREAVYAGLALVSAFEEIGCPRDLIERHKVSNTNNLRYAWFLLILRASSPGEWKPLRRKLLKTHSASWMVRATLALGWLVPTPVVHWCHRDRLQRVHRAVEKLKVAAYLMAPSARRRKIS